MTRRLALVALAAYVTGVALGVALCTRAWAKASGENR